jgi:2-oxo-hept-3-ene-1,7-dioate hydratase
MIGDASMTENDVRKAAVQLDGVAKTRVPVPILSATRPGMTMQDGYAIQRAWSALRQSRGDDLVGYKIGLTSRAMQLQLKVDAPQFGRLHESHRCQTGAWLSTVQYMKPRVEIELAFVLKSALSGPGIGITEVIAATDSVQPAIEIVDYRTEVPRHVADMIADNTAAAGFILGGQRIAPSKVDLEWIAAVVLKNDIVEETGVSSGILGHPAMSVAWLANRLADDNLYLRSGDIVLAGSMTRQIEVLAGDRFLAKFGALGTISIDWA